MWWYFCRRLWTLVFQSPVQTPSTSSCSLWWASCWTRWHKRSWTGVEAASGHSHPCTPFLTAVCGGCRMCNGYSMIDAVLGVLSKSRIDDEEGSIGAVLFSIRQLSPSVCRVRL